MISKSLFCYIAFFIFLIYIDNSIRKVINSPWIRVNFNNEFSETSFKKSTIYICGKNLEKFKINLGINFAGIKIPDENDIIKDKIFVKLFNIFMLSVIDVKTCDIETDVNAYISKAITILVKSKSFKWFLNWKAKYEEKSPVIIVAIIICDRNCETTSLVSFVGAIFNLLSIFSSLNSIEIFAKTDNIAENMT